MQKIGEEVGCSEKKRSKWSSQHEDKWEWNWEPKVVLEGGEECEKLGYEWLCKYKGQKWETVNSSIDNLHHNFYVNNKP